MCASLCIIEACQVWCGRPHLHLNPIDAAYRPLARPDRRPPNPRPPAHCLTCLAWRPSLEAGSKTGSLVLCLSSLSSGLAVLLCSAWRLDRRLAARGRSLGVQGRGRLGCGSPPRDTGTPCRGSMSR